MTHSLFRVQENRERMLPRGIRLRRAGEEDEQATFDVMRRSMGHDMNWMHHLPTRRHLRAMPASSYWVAEETHRFGKARPVGYAHSIVRDRVWSLTEFFVLPTHHRQGIGRALLADCLLDGDQAGANTRLVLASQSPSADSLYIRTAGCYPRLPMFLLSGPAANVQVLPPSSTTAIQDTIVPSSSTSSSTFSTLDTPAWQTRASSRQPGLDPLHQPERACPGQLIATPIDPTPDVQRQLDQLDREIVGYARGPEHQLWAEEMGGPLGASRLFREADTSQIVGYTYFGAHSSGPALARDPRLLPPMMAHVMRVSRQYEGNPQNFGLLEAADPYWAIAGTNEIVMRWLLECGWQIVFQYLFMSSRSLGQMDRYVCHNPLYVL